MIQALQKKFATVHWKSKFKAFAVHFSLSLLIFIVLFYLIVYVWYPFPFFSTDGGIQGMRLVFFIDLVLGPMLTLVVFKKNKPGLKFDLTIIAIMQTLALGWGVGVIYNERPVAIVFADDRFSPIPHYQLKEAGIKPSDLKKYSAKTPAVIYVNLPDEKDHEARYKFFIEAYRNKKAIFLYGSRYQQFNKRNIEKVIQKSIDIETYLNQDYISENHEIWQQRYQDFLDNNTQSEKNLAFIAFYARHGKYILVVDRHTLDFINVLDIKPPQSTKTVFKLEGKDS